MTRCCIRVKVCVLAICLFGTPNALQLLAQGPPQSAVAQDFHEVLSWLPQDTETVTVARGPFVLPSASAQAKVGEDENRPITSQELAESFEALPLSLLGFKDGLLLSHIKGKQILLAVEGARHFRPPAGLGEMLYEGCVIVQFADDLSFDLNLFIKQNQRSVWRVEQMQGRSIVVFQEKLENDTWTTFVAFPNKRILVVATNRDYLKEVLSRQQGKRGNRALPDDLPEWKYVNTDLRFWGLRHFDKGQANADPTSPFGANMFGNHTRDDQAVGLVFNFDETKGKVVKATYLSGDKNLRAKHDASIFSLTNWPEAKGLDIEYREFAPGIVEASYTLKNSAHAQIFFFVFDAMLGHAVFI